MIHEPLVLVALYVATATLLRILAPHRITNTIFAIVLVASTGYVIRHHADDVRGAWGRGWAYARGLASGSPDQPQLGTTFPDLTLVDQEGQPTRLSDFRGKVILVEYVGMSCPACVALAGGHRRGAYDNCAPQGDLESIRAYASAYGRVNWNHKDFVFVQIVLFNPEMLPPTLADIEKWAKHFGFKRSANRIVLAGTAELATNANRDLIPGFQLIDRDFQLRADSSGPHPRHDLYLELLPMLGELLEKK